MPPQGVTFAGDLATLCAEKSSHCRLLLQRFYKADSQKQRKFFPDGWCAKRSAAQ
jgi:hypothetical protein